MDGFNSVYKPLICEEKEKEEPDLVMLDALSKSPTEKVAKPTLDSPDKQDTNDTGDDFEEGVEKEILIKRFVKMEQDQETLKHKLNND
jgi:hypothetical protein